MALDRDFHVDPKRLSRYLAIGGVVFAFIIFASSSTYIVDPGHRGIVITMGKVSPHFAPEVFGIKTPFVTTVIPVSVRQQTRSMKTECYSSDLQQVNVELKVLYRLPEKAVVNIYQAYAGDPFESLVVPRISEALKEVTAMQSAEQIVKRREEIKTKAFSAAKQKIGDVLFIEDIVLQDITLSPELEQAIEAKMVQEQEAAKAKFIQQKTEIEARTAVIRAKGEAEAIQVRGEAIKRNPGLVDLQIVEKWDGKAPLVVGGSKGGASIILPLSALKGVE